MNVSMLMLVAQVAQVHLCEIRRAEVGAGWLAVCSCGFSAGNFLEYEAAHDEGHAHLNTAATTGDQS